MKENKQAIILLLAGAFMIFAGTWRILIEGSKSLDFIVVGSLLELLCAYIISEDVLEREGEQ